MTIAPYSPPGAGGASDAPTTPAAPAATPTPPATVPTLPTGPTATGLDPSIGNKPLVGAAPLNPTAAVAPKPLNEKQIVQELASELKVTAQKGQSLENGVIDALASKYGVRVPLTTSGTGTGQGAVGSARHNIASWFHDAVSVATTGGLVHKAQQEVNQQTTEERRAEAMKIKDPKLRELALKKVNQEEAGGLAPETGQPVPDESKVALNEMLQKVQQKLGVSQTPGVNDAGLAEVAQRQGLPTQTPGAPATPGGVQTAGEAYQSFVKQLADPKTAAQTAAGVVPLLEQAGLLDRNSTSATSATKQANGTTFSNAQISTAYQQVLSTAVKNNQSQDAALNSLAKQGAEANGPTSEMEAYVQGVATEFGVGLTTQQLTEIANTYGQNAATADDPASVADEIKDAVMSLYDPTNPNNPAGVADTMFTNIQAAALNYGIPISAQQIGNMVKQDLQGATVQSVYATADAAQSEAVKQFQQQAAGLYPALADQIKAGQTVQNLTAPYFNVAEAITGVPASTMMADQAKGGVSKWAAFLQGGNNPAGATKTNVAPGAQNTSGGPQMMTLDQWKTYLMQNPNYGFQNTQGARDMAEQMTSAILNEFGKVNTNGGSSQPFNAFNGASDLSANTSSA